VIERVDVLVVGAGPAGCTAARAAAEEGARVLIVERKPTVGLPVQCAEYVPTQIVRYAPLSERCIAQRIRSMHTYLPDGERAVTRAAGYVIDRALFDKGLAVAACRAGARIWTSTPAVERTERGALVRRGGQAIGVESQIVIGADGPRSTVGRWVGCTHSAYLHAAEVEVVLAEARECTEVYFHPRYRGGYGWLFPKGDTANVGVGVSRQMGGDAREALAHLLDRLAIPAGAVVGRTRGLVPTSGMVSSLRTGNVLLAGDAAGCTHPVTGAGVAAAVIAGSLAGSAAARALQSGDLDALDAYEREWSSTMAGPLRHALTKRRELDRRWIDEPTALSAAVRETWIAFKDYGRRRGRTEL
jgi:geranylgeranyl reductase family protein